MLAFTRLPPDEREPVKGMVLMAREEANIRQAIRVAFQSGAANEAWLMADLFREYLAMAGRFKERDDLTAWVRENFPLDNLAGASRGGALDHAWTLFTRGKVTRAIQMVRNLIFHWKRPVQGNGRNPAHRQSMDL